MLSKFQVSSLENDRSFVRREAKQRQQFTPWLKERVSSPERNERSLSPRKGSKQRQQFTPWLKEQIESGDIDGLEWIDKELGIFSLP